MGLSGEFTAADTVVARQQTDPQTLLGLAYSDSSLYVKARRLAQVHPEVLALGNSRVMQFRSGFFRPGVRFYNAGGAVSMVQDFRVYLERLAPRRCAPVPGSSPRMTPSSIHRPTERPRSRIICASRNDS